MNSADATPLNHPESVSLFGGVAGGTLEVSEFELCSGLTVYNTYAHVMAPYLMAFKKPSKKGDHHPPPWKAAKGGLGFDITIEFFLSKEARPTSFDRVNTLWWVLSLIRLRSGASIRMPVISDTKFNLISDSISEPNLWTIEMHNRQLPTVLNPPRKISVQHLDWVKNNFIEGDALIGNASFNRAYQTFDSVIWAHSTGSAILMTWAALETIFRPGRVNIGKNLAICIATFLCPPGPHRDRTFQTTQILYEARGKAAHDSQIPEAEQLLQSFEVARNSIIKCLEHRKLPDADALLKNWKEKS